MIHDCCLSWSYIPSHWTPPFSSLLLYSVPCLIDFHVCIAQFGYQPWLQSSIPWNHKPNILLDPTEIIIPYLLPQIKMAITSRGKSMIAIVSVLVGLSVLAVILRVFARIKRRVKLGVDDYLCFLSIVMLIAMEIELVLCKSHRVQRFEPVADHMW